MPLVLSSLLVLSRWLIPEPLNCFLSFDGLSLRS